MDHASSSSDLDPAAPLVLIVDDSTTMRRSVSMTLETAGYRVCSAANGEDALRLLDDGLRPALLITDIVMPKVDGVALIRGARERLRFMPVIALTTQGQRGLRDEGKLAGATAWLIKPVGGRELLDMVERFAGPPRAQRPAA